MTTQSHGAKATAELLERFGLAPDKALGQHFLIDPNQVDRIVRLGRVTSGDRVVEVGPGLGALTSGLLDAGATVVAVEIDSGMAKAIEAQFDSPKLRVVTADALKVEWDALADPAQTWSMIANLPYNVATPLVLDVLDQVPQIETLLVMVQREVAERLAAAPGSKLYGAPSVKVAYWGSAELVAKVPPTVFLPPPKVESAMVRIVRGPARATDPKLVFQLVRAGFGQRRKMLRKSLAAHVEPSDFEHAQIEPTERPEQLDVQAWCRLAQAKTIRLGHGPEAV